MPGCLLLDAGGRLLLDASGCLRLDGGVSDAVGFGGLRVYVDGVERTDALRGIVLESRLDEVGSAEIRLLAGIDEELPPAGVTVTVEDRETGRVLFNGLLDEPVAAILTGSSLKEQTLYASDGMRRLEDLRLSTEQGVAVARATTWQAQARLLVGFLNQFGDYDAGFSLADSEWEDTTPAGIPAERDFRGETIADAFRAIVAASGDGSLFISSDRMIRRGGLRGATPLVYQTESIESVDLDLDRQHQRTRSCVIGDAPFELVDTFVGRHDFYDLGQREGRVSLFQPPGSTVVLPGVLWAFRTGVPGGFFTQSDYRSDNRGIYATTHVKGDDPTWPNIWRASNPLASGSTTQTGNVYVVRLEWGMERLTLDLGLTDRDRSAAIAWATGIDPWVLARNLQGRVTRARITDATDPYQEDVLEQAVNHGRLEERIETDTVIVNAAHESIDVGLATTVDVNNATGRPPVRVLRVLRIEREVQPGGPNDFIETALNDDEGDPLWRLDVARHRVIAPANFVSTDTTVLGVRITYEAVWEVEADAGGGLPIIRIEEADETLTREEARAAALQEIARNADPVQVVTMALTPDAGRHLELGTSLTLPADLTRRMGAPTETVTESPDVPVWVVDAVTINDLGNRLAYTARLCRDRHRSEYAEFWRDSLQ